MRGDRVRCCRCGPSNNSSSGGERNGSSIPPSPKGEKLTIIGPYLHSLVTPAQNCYTGVRPIGLAFPVLREPVENLKPESLLVSACKEAMASASRSARSRCRCARCGRWKHASINTASHVQRPAEASFPSCFIAASCCASPASQSATSGVVSTRIIVFDVAVYERWPLGQPSYRVCRNRAAKCPEDRGAIQKRAA